jgi:hypothetical protein
MIINNIIMIIFDIDVNIEVLFPRPNRDVNAMWEHQLSA